MLNAYQRWLSFSCLKWHEGVPTSPWADPRRCGLVMQHVCLTLILQSNLDLTVSDLPQSSWQSGQLCTRHNFAT